MKLKELFEEEERSVLNVIGQQPEYLPRTFNCSNRSLTSLEGSPQVVGGDFNCSYNGLKSLKGGPGSVSGEFDATGNDLVSLEDLPASIGTNLHIFGNNVITLHNIHKHIKHIGGYAVFKNNQIISHVLGLLLIDGLKEVYLDYKIVQDIINKHLSGDRDVFACQEELIEAGFEEYAQL